MPQVGARLLRGFRDFLPAEMLLRERIIARIRRVYESYGFVPISTPAIEYRDVLLGYGEEASKQIYLFREPDGNDVGLRFDLTVPLSRVTAQYQDLPRPFKRYQIQPVWRYDKPDPGRFREFMQFDIDTVGTASMIADAEIISAIHDSLAVLGLPSRIRLSHRKILNSVVRFAGISADLACPVFRVLDKLEKQGLDNVMMELGDGREDESGAQIPGLGLSRGQIARIADFLSLPQSTREQALDSIETLFRDLPEAEEGIEELREIHRFLEALGISDTDAAIDFSIARGLDYYTGPVFEAVLSDKRLEGMGSVMGGGRYDELIGSFTGENLPATGASIGVDRLFAAVEQLGLEECRPSTADVLVTVMMPDMKAEYARIAGILRREGINTELYTGRDTSIGRQLKYADKQGIPIAVIMGPDEKADAAVSVKDLRAVERTDIEISSRDEWVKRKVGQRTVPFSDLADEVRRILSGE